MDARRRRKSKGKTQHTASIEPVSIVLLLLACREKERIESVCLRWSYGKEKAEKRLRKLRIETQQKGKQERRKRSKTGRRTMVLSPRISSLTALLLLASSAFLGGVLVQATLDEPFSDSFSQLEHAPCTRLFTRNGQMGCGTESRSVDVGKLVYYEGSLPATDENYVSVVEDYDLTAETLDTLLQARGGLLQGILVLNSTSSSSSGSSSGSRATSPDSQTPQGSGTPSYNVNYGYSGYKWNSKGEGLFGYDLYGVAMAFVPDSDVAQSIRQNSLGQSAGGAKADIVAEFNYYMGPESVTSQECLAWRDASSGEWNPKCLPLGGTSVWAVAGSPPKASSSNRPVILLSAAMDSTSLFHDIAPGANTAASNILTVLMAAKLIGTYVKDEVLDALPNAIALALFQGETYGFVGSRSFLRDLAYPGFQCNGTQVKSSHHDSSDSASTDYACLYPLRPSLKFANLGQVQGMLSVDQVGHAVANGILYVHADENNDQTGSWLANLLKYSSTNKVSVASSSAGRQQQQRQWLSLPTVATHVAAAAFGRRRRWSRAHGIRLQFYQHGRVPFALGFRIVVQCRTRFHCGRSHHDGTSRAGLCLRRWHVFRKRRLRHAHHLRQ